jgi:hypothetical protein
MYALALPRNFFAIALSVSPDCTVYVSGAGDAVCCGCAAGGAEWLAAGAVTLMSATISFCQSGHGLQGVPNLVRFVLIVDGPMEVQLAVAFVGRPLEFQLLRGLDCVVVFFA